MNITKLITKPILVCIALLIITLPVHALEWSEILFNPLGNDNGKEYVELIGTESLSGCTIRDASSVDTLILFHQGIPSNDIIMILENDSYWINASANATTYVIGSAIGNGLGNTFETINISCGSVLLFTSYNTTLLSNYTEGESIIFNNNSWITSSMNGTPGVKNPITPNPITISTNISNNSNSNTSNFNSSGVNNLNNSNSSNQTIITDDSSSNAYSGGISCNSSLGITLSATNASVGETVSFTILSESFVTYDIVVNGTSIANGDTLTTRTHSITIPNTTLLKVVAYANACGRKQRTTRYITVTQPIDEENEPYMENAGAHIATQVQTTESTHQVQENAMQHAEIATGAVIIDQNRSAIPWICGFGAITVIAACVVFLQLLRRGEH